MVEWLLSSNDGERLPAKETQRRQLSGRMRRTRSRTISSYEPEIRRREPAEIRKHRRQVPAVHAEPGSERGEILVACSRWNPTSGACIVRSIDGERGELSVGTLTVDGAAHDEVVAAPAMITARSVAGERATKIARRKCRHLVRK